MDEQAEVIEPGVTRLGDHIDLKKWRAMAERRKTAKNRRVSEETCKNLGLTHMWDEVKRIPLGFRKRKKAGRTIEWVYACSEETAWPQLVNVALDLLDATCDPDHVAANETEIRRRLIARLRSSQIADEKRFRGQTDDGAFEILGDA